MLDRRVSTMRLNDARVWRHYTTESEGGADGHARAPLCRDEMDASKPIVRSSIAEDAKIAV